PFSPHAWSAMPILFLIFLGQEEKITLPVGLTQRRRRRRPFLDCLLTAVPPVAVNAVRGLTRPVLPAQGSDHPIPDGKLGGFTLRPVSPRSGGLDDLTGVLSPRRFREPGRPLTHRDARAEQLQKDRQEFIVCAGPEPASLGLLEEFAYACVTEGGGLPIRRQPGPDKGVPVVGERVLEENAAAVSGIPADDPLALVLSAAGRVLAPVKVQGW